MLASITGADEPLDKCFEIFGSTSSADPSTSSTFSSSAGGFASRIEKKQAEDNTRRHYIQTVMTRGRQAAGGKWYVNTKRGSMKRYI